MEYYSDRIKLEMEQKDNQNIHSYLKIKLYMFNNP